MIVSILAAGFLLSSAALAPLTAQFDRGVANLEFYEGRLYTEPPGMPAPPSPDGGTVWHGSIMRRLPGDTLHDASNYVSFAAEYTRGTATRAWCDANGNGDFLDDPPVSFSAYPSPPGARSFLVNLGWTARAADRPVPIESTIRVVLEPRTDGEKTPIYRLQRVHAMMGDVTLAGRPHKSILFDGNGDGLYTREFPDGFYVDLDDDLHFEIDAMSPGFAPLGAPFVMDGRRYEVASIDPEGRVMTYRDLGPADEPMQAVVGQMAPDFAFDDLAGRTVRLADYRGRVVLLYFWASWCGACEEQAPGLSALYERHRAAGVEILGVSFDTERRAMTAFRAAHGQKWPTSFSGRPFWEDPVGKLYRARVTGSIHLIDREGRLRGAFTDLEELSARLAERVDDHPAAAIPAR